MPTQSIQLRCPACGSVDRLVSQPRASWVSIEAYGGGEWPGASLPTGEVWLHSNIVPRPGDDRHVKVSHPFAAVSDELFWLMFVPGFSGPDGWADNPETIASSAFVLCRLAKVVKRAASWAWFAVAIDDVLAMPEIERRFTARFGQLPQTERHQTVVRTSFEGWELIAGSSEGDVGLWLLARRAQQSIHLLAEGRWSFHEDVVRAGNLEISGKQWERLSEGMMLS